MSANWLRYPLLVTWLCACGAARDGKLPTKRLASEDAGTGMGFRSSADDSDHDGLCDDTERRIGTDPNAADTDHDGLPDLVEAGNGFDPVDPQSPAADQVGRLPALSGATLDFPVRATVEGNGQGISGAFTELDSLYVDGTTAADFLTSEAAISADPSESVRSIITDSARFVAVLGKTRLEFQARFKYSGNPAISQCTRAYPFRYSLKGDDGKPIGQRLFLLLVVPHNADGTDAPHCLPSQCQ